MISFTPLSLKDANIIRNFVSQFEPYSDFNFTSLYCWANGGQTMYSIDKNVLYLTMPDYLTKEPIYTFLCLSSSTNALKDFLAWLDFNEFNQNYSFSLLPEPSLESAVKYLNSSGYKYQFNEDQDNNDYLLSASKVYEANGPEYAQFRYKLSKLKRDWDDRLKTFNFIPSSVDHMGLARNLTAKWSLRKIEQGLPYKTELDAFERFLELTAKNSDHIGFVAYVIDDELVALASYEIVSDHYALGHFLKYDPSIRNIYYQLVYDTCEKLYQLGIPYLNIEQDLGITGLRDAKMQLQPVNFLKKFSLQVVKKV